MSENIQRKTKSGGMGGGENPATIGRGSGMTIKEVKRRIQDFMKRKNMPNEHWRKKRAA